LDGGERDGASEPQWVGMRARARAGEGAGAGE